jgi:hypothetical protein
MAEEHRGDDNTETRLPSGPGGGTMKIKAFDTTQDTHIELTASLTTDHPASSYGQAVMVIDEWDGEVQQ